MDLQYMQRIEKIEAVLRDWLPEKPSPVWMAKVFPGLENAVSPAQARALIEGGWDLVNRGGKRWRPLLMALVCESLGGGDVALPLTPLVEFCHNASLIHDDIEDNSDERRGKPAIHLLYGSDTAINGGAFLYFLPLACLEAWEGPPEWKNLMYRLWGEYMRRLHLGQSMDITWHRDFSSLPKPDEYDRMCRLKTGCLARLAAVLGVYTAACQAELPAAQKAVHAAAETLGIAAENLGVGFQILDDVKNLTTGIPGKKRGDDVVEGKKSLPALLYLHRYPEKRDFTARCFRAARKAGTQAPEVEELIGELDRAGVLQEAEEQGRALILEAKRVLSAIPDVFCYDKATGRDLLAGFTDLIG
jgi:octaprenyl-diphosphate synthase